MLVQLPDGALAIFPDDMGMAEIEAVLVSTYPQYSGTRLPVDDGDLQVSNLAQGRGKPENTGYRGEAIDMPTPMSDMPLPKRAISETYSKGLDGKGLRDTYSSGPQDFWGKKTYLPNGNSFGYLSKAK
jgi:hypothetical protein